jgi:hypothetical protein
MATRQKRFIVNSGSSLVAGAVLYDKPCLVHAVHAIHSTGAATAIAIFDSATVPANGTLPLALHRIEANSDGDIEHTDPLFFENGLYVCETTTIPLKTISLSADIFIHALITDRDYRP